MTISTRYIFFLIFKNLRLTFQLRPGSNKCHRSAQLLLSPLGGASWVGQIGWILGQGPGRGGQRGGQRLGWGTLVGDQRRRNKSRGCQKEWEDQEEGEERVGGYMQVYTEWVWPLFTVHSGERKSGDKQETRAGNRECRRRTEEREQGIKRKKQMTDEMSREGTEKDMEETRRKKRKKRGKEDHRQEE